MNANTVIARATAHGGAHFGDLVYTDFCSVAEALIERDQVRDALVRHGLSPLLIEDTERVQGAFGKACRETRTAVEGYVLDRAQKRDRTVAVFQLVPGPSGIPVQSREPVAVLAVQRDGTLDVLRGDGCDAGAEQAIQTVGDCLAWHLRYIDHAQLGAFVRRALIQWFGGSRMRRRGGGLFFTPTNVADQVRALAIVIDSLADTQMVVWPQYESQETLANARTGIAQGLLGDVEDVLHDIAAYREKLGDGRAVRATTIEARMEELASVRARAALVAHILDMRTSEIEDAVKTAEAEVQGLFAKLDAL